MLGGRHLALGLGMYVQYRKGGCMQTKHETIGKSPSGLQRKDQMPSHPDQSVEGLSGCFCCCCLACLALVPQYCYKLRQALDSTALDHRE